MKKSVVVALHAGYWFLYEILLTAFFLLSNSDRAVSSWGWDDLVMMLSMATIVGVASFYTFYLWLVPSYLPVRRVKAFVASGLLISVLVAVLATLIFSLLITLIVFVFFEKLDFSLLSMKDQVWLMTAFALLAIINGILGTTIRGFITWFSELQEKQLLTNSKLQTEMALLKAQINPHFLFNSLNNIDVLIDHDSKRASLYLNKLSGLLRYVLYEAQTDWVLLEKELAYIQAYIELQKIRTVNDEYVTFEIKGHTDQAMIPSMILIPYIENAFKYATNKKSVGAVRISIVIGESEIVFSCFNKIDKKSSHGTGKGLGNRLSSQRLDLLFQKNYELDLNHGEKEYTVHLRIPVKAHELFAD